MSRMRQPWDRCHVAAGTIPLPSPPGAWPFRTQTARAGVNCPFDSPDHQLDRQSIWNHRPVDHMYFDLTCARQPLPWTCPFPPCCHHLRKRYINLTNKYKLTFSGLVLVRWFLLCIGLILLGLDLGKVFFVKIVNNILGYLIVQFDPSRRISLNWFWPWRLDG